MKKSANFLIIFLLLLTVLLSPVSAVAEPVEYSIDFELNSRAALLVNLDTDTEVFAQEADTRLEPASLTKIMVSLMTLENVPDLVNTKITVPEYIFTLLAGTNSSVSGIKKGEVLTAEQLLYCLMVPSGNDAAMVLADYLGGGDIAKFVQMMNQRAKELGMSNTNFANPHGLHDPSHYTTARDLATLTKYILNSQYADTFMTICKTTRYTVPANEIRTKALSLATTNLMMDTYTGGKKYYYKYTEGVKTGSTEEAGFCLVTTAYNATVDYRYLCVCMGADLRDEEGVKKANGAMLDSINLYNWAFETFRYQTLVNSGTPVAEVKLKYAWEKDSILLVPEKAFSALVPEQINMKSIVLVPDESIPKEMDAPVEKGQVVGTAKVTYAGMTLGTVNLIINESVESSQLLIFQEQAQRMLSSKWLKVGVAVFVSLLALYFVVSLTYNIKRKKNRRRNASGGGYSSKYRK